MVLSEFLAMVRERGANITEAQFRFAIKTSRIPRPRLDAAHRYDFTPSDVENAVRFFGCKTEAASCV